MKILLASDGSDFSLVAAGKMSEIVALDGDSEVLIVSVSEPVAPSSRLLAADEYLVLARKASVGAASAAAEATREKLVQSVRNKGVQIETRIVEGNPKSRIVNVAKNWNADLVVTGSHGRGFLGRMLIGSVSDAVVKHSPCSVLVIRK